MFVWEDGAVFVLLEEKRHEAALGPPWETKKPYNIKELSVASTSIE